MRKFGALLTCLAVLLLVSPGLAADPAPEAKDGAKTEAKGAAEKTPAKATQKEGAALDDEINTVSERGRMKPTVVTATRGPHSVYDQPRNVTAIVRETIEEQAPVQVVQTMTNTNPGIIMDIRTGTTGDPIMRGWAGFNILTLIDGNTLSTLWGEGGFGADDMYAKIDPETVERMEIIHGPYSCLWGSNALGGVINFITRSSPIDYQEEGFEYGGRAKYTFTENGTTNRFRLEGFGATPDIKFLIGWSYVDAGNLEGGRGEGTLDPTSGNADHFDARLDWLIAPGHEIYFQILDINWRETHRYYRPYQDNDTDRTGVTVSYNAKKLGFMENFNARLYYQYKEDYRRFYDSGREGYARTQTYCADVRGSSDAGAGNYLTYGLHASLDKGESADDEQFTYVKPSPETADAPDTNWSDLAAYLQDEWTATDWLSVIGVLRYDYFIFESKPTDTYLVGDPYREEDFFTDRTGALTGGLGLTFKPAEEWRILGSYSRGFRQHAPNFGFRQLGNGVLIPNELLDPVTSDNFEVGFRTKYDWIDFDAFGYYSLIHDSTEVRPDTYQGSDWIDFNGNGVRDANEGVVSHQPTGGGYIYGFEFTGTIYPHFIAGDIPPNWSMRGGLAWNYGKTEDGEWYRHTQPLRGLFGIRWDDSNAKRGAYVEFLMDMTGKYDRIPADRVDTDLAWQRDPQNPAGAAGLLRSYGGVPGYTVFNLYGGINLCENARLLMVLENFTNKKYRRAHSRMDAPGISFTIGLDVVF